MPAAVEPGRGSVVEPALQPLFGAILHMKNWQAMGEPQKAATSKNWVIATTIFLACSIALAVAWPDSKAVDQLSRLAGFVLLVAWYYAIGKSQRAVVIARYGKDYPRKGWAKPLGLAVAALIGFVAAAMVVGFIAAMLTGASH